MERRRITPFPPRPETVARAHVADLRSAYAVSGLDVVELRAVYASLPTAFENDGDGRKRAWAEGVREKDAAVFCF